MDELSCYDAPVRPTGGSLAEICLNDLPVGSTGIPCKARANQCSVGLAFGLRVALFRVQIRNLETGDHSRSKTLFLYSIYYALTAGKPAPINP